MSDRRKKARMMSESDRDDEILTLRFLMNGKEAGTLIGKGGQTIQNLRKSSDAIINISDNASKERVVSVTGAVNNIMSAFKLIVTTIEENLLNNDRSSYTPLTFQLMVPSGQCGSLIGSGGSKIKLIREKSGAHIQIATDPLPMSTERMITLSGKPENINLCMKSLCEIMVEYPVRGHVDPYYPQNYHSNRPSRSERDYSETRDHYERGREPSRYSSRNSSSRRRKRSEDYDEYMTETMAIPSRYAGGVIGKRGTKISEIRSKSGAAIKIADETDGSGERIVTISGNPEAVGMAQFLIKTRVKYEEKRDTSKD
ncbi:poly(rC)-binding protein 3-like [Dendronephthya gigantea]|uniref:poly(rC)-binding protein 3-like n=1 Tax=Dendronephthya gigantea TaxID=151771 RepID=UPI00106B0B7D|nr:poly(rC)-binding protein 3-like [Dendronephthya gigantea]